MAQVFVGIGSSVNKVESIKAGLVILNTEFTGLKASAVYESEAVGFVGGNFYNLVVEFETDLTVQTLVSRLKSIEIQHGKAEHTEKFSPRTLDLDLLLYDNLVDLTLNVPRSEIIENAFVLKPLVELAPNLKHPLLDETYKKLWDDYPKEKQKLWKINHHF